MTHGITMALRTETGRESRGLTDGEQRKDMQKEVSSRDHTLRKIKDCN